MKELSSEMEGWEPVSQYKFGFLETGIHERVLAEESADPSYSLRR